MEFCSREIFALNKFTLSQINAAVREASPMKDSLEALRC